MTFRSPFIAILLASSAVIAATACGGSQGPPSQGSDTVCGRGGESGPPQSAMLAPGGPSSASGLPSAAEAAFRWKGAKGDGDSGLSAVLDALGAKSEGKPRAFQVTYATAGDIIFRTRARNGKSVHTLKLRSPIASQPSLAGLDALLNLCIDAPKDELDVGAGPAESGFVSHSCIVEQRPESLGLKDGACGLTFQSWDLEAPARCKLEDWTLERWERTAPDGAVDVLWEVSAKGSRTTIVSRFKDCASSKLEPLGRGKAVAEAKTVWGTSCPAVSSSQ